MAGAAPRSAAAVYGLRDGAAAGGRSVSGGEPAAALAGDFYTGEERVEAGRGRGGNGGHMKRAGGKTGGCGQAREVDPAHARSHPNCPLPGVMRPPLQPLPTPAFNPVLTVFDKKRSPRARHVAIPGAHCTLAGTRPFRFGTVTCDGRAATLPLLARSASQASPARGDSGCIQRPCSRLIRAELPAELPDRLSPFRAGDETADRMPRAPERNVAGAGCARKCPRARRISAPA